MLLITLKCLIAKDSFRTNRRLATDNSVKDKVSYKLNVKHFTKNRLDFTPYKDKGMFEIIKTVLHKAIKTLNTMFF